MKKLCSLLLVGALAAATFSFAACAKKIPDTEDFLQVYCVNFGYGTDWVDAVAEKFFAQDWVQEKYPGANIKDNYALQVEDDQGYGSTRLSNPSTNAFDLMFDMWLQSSLIPGGNALDLTDAVYNSQVPGETDAEGNPVLFKDKMKDSFVEMNRYLNVNDPDSEQYFSVSWADGMNSIIYNEANLNSLYAKHPELNKEAGETPNTTDELIAVCRALREDWDNAHTGQYEWQDGGFAFYQSKDDTYLTNLFNVWWAQYEGTAGFEDYWNGIPTNSITGEPELSVFSTHEGRYEALETMRSLLRYHGNSYSGSDRNGVSYSSIDSGNGGYLDPNGWANGFKQVQTKFLNSPSLEEGGWLFNANGDWFASEMSKTLSEVENPDNFKMMRTPVISSLGSKYGIGDDLLSAMIDYVDDTSRTVDQELIDHYFQGSDKKSAAGFTYQQVLEAVAAARGVVHSIGGVHYGLIPANATAKDMAVDFLRFMATDIAQDAYAQATDGASLPFNYNIREKNPELYNQFSAIQKSRIDYFYPETETLYTVNTLPMENRYALYYYGQVTAFQPTEWYTVLRQDKNDKTPVYYWNETVSYWTQSRFDTALQRAGLK